MDIYAYLKKDHKKVSALFKEIITSEDPQMRENLFLELKKELELHADPERKTFYQALQKNAKGKQEAEHGDEEHNEIKKALAKLSKVSPDDTAMWFVTLGELKRIVEHHVEEEEKEMFALGKKIISASKAKNLVEEMEELKLKMMSLKSFMTKYSSLEQDSLDV